MKSEGSSYWAPDLKQRVAASVIALGIGTALMLLKFYIWRLTGSSAVLSDALESIINIVASAFALGSVLLAAAPPDEDHPYGHGKVEYFSAGFEGALIVLAAAGIFVAGIQRLLEPRGLPHLDLGLALLLAASLVNLLLGVLLLRVGRRTDSLTLVADAKHVLTDVVTSVGVLLGLGLVAVTGWLWLDGLVACLVGAQILITGVRLVRQSLHGLMDSSDPQLLDRIARLLQENRRPHWIDVHRLRAWRAGSLVHIDLHLVLPDRFSLVQAHAEVKDLEGLLLAAFNGNASVLIHADPCGAGDCEICGESDCIHRRQERSATSLWSRQCLTQTMGDDR